MRKISFVIPCYRSALTIEKVLCEIETTMLSRRKDFTYEIICVNDGSPDDTAKVLSELCDSHPALVFVDLTRNFGQHSALMAGFNNVSGELVLCLDDDGQTPADELFSLVDKLDEGYDLVYASYPEKKHNLFRRWGSSFNRLCSHILVGTAKELKTSSYFVCRRFVVDSATKYTNPYPYVAGLLHQATRRVTSVSVQHRERKTGRSGYTLKKLLSLWSNNLTAFSVIPLRIATFIGMGVSVIGFITAIVTVVNKLLHPEVMEGWSSLMAVLLVIGGLLMLLIGVLGEYVGRIYISLNNLPQFLIREVKSGKEQKGGRQ